MKSDITAQNIEEAIDNGEMLLHYQPQSNLTSGEITGLEALVRWHSKTLGHVDTAHFINILEHSDINLIAKFHRWLTITAFEQILTWQQVGISLPVYLNFSTRYLQERDCLNLIKSLIHDYQISPSAFGIEVTESYSIKDMDGIKFVLSELHNMEIRIALDDFCTSYCSLEYLSDLPADIIKIDKRFIQGLTSDNFQRQNSIQIIVESTVEMAFRLGIEVVAEGVETLKQLEAVTFLGCDTYQGYLLCPPVPVALITQMIISERTRRDSHINLSSEPFWQAIAI
ncbi:EAL domain-containing protein [Synechococcus sp. PCC 7502]|uniref:EAL domain-containing protein n=1 Tax=Synechococcus sp. PCC 7502 TaxID=1173263 RepID=UPI00029FD416|nr:EAL domain-containing protein [Synechococcus sp. PCC 7502]AFY73805.1 EAL domain-containing protein [Synechococcus sp. PCC 7502]